MHSIGSTYKAAEALKCDQSTVAKILKKTRGGGVQVSSCPRRQKLKCERLLMKKIIKNNDFFIGFYFFEIKEKTVIVTLYLFTGI